MGLESSGTQFNQPVWTQSAELLAAFKKYESLSKQGKYTEAIPFAGTAVELSKVEFGGAHQFSDVRLNRLAQLYVTQSR